METVVEDPLLFVNTGLCHHLPVIQLVSLWEQIDSSPAQSPEEHCATLHEGHHLVPSEMMEEGL